MQSFCHSPVKISPDEGVSNHSAVVKATEPNPTRTPVTPPLQPPPLSRKITAVDSISEASASLSCDTAATHDSHQEDHYKGFRTSLLYTIIVIFSISSIFIISLINLYFTTMYL